MAKGKNSRKSKFRNKWNRFKKVKIKKNRKKRKTPQSTPAKAQRRGRGL